MIMRTCAYNSSYCTSIMTCYVIAWMCPPGVKEPRQNLRLASMALTPPALQMQFDFFYGCCESYWPKGLSSNLATLSLAREHTEAPLIMRRCAYNSSYVDNNLLHHCMDVHACGAGAVAIPPDGADGVDGACAPDGVDAACALDASEINSSRSMTWPRILTMSCMDGRWRS